jgi:hypothetical protein
MHLDIRYPIGAMFALFGVILTIYGLTTGSSEIYAKSLNFNINLWWGIVLFGFGAVMLALAWRAAPEKKPE